MSAAITVPARAWWNFREHPQRAVGLLAFAAVLAIALSVLYLLMDLREHELAEELEQTQRLTSVLAEQSTQYLSLIHI